jgi:hypothetical protein
MSYADLDLACWRRLDGAAAQRLADRIADNTGAELVEVRPHEYAGRPGRIALYRRDGTMYALVPGGEVVLGYDGAWFTPTPDQAADYAAWPDGLPSDIRAFVGFVTSPPRVMHLPTLLVAVEAVEPGVRPADPDDPRVGQQLADLQTSWEHDRPPGMISHDDWGRVEVTVDDRCQPTSAPVVEYVARDAVVADLAGRGLRLLTPDEWEHACGAGAMTLFRWGDDCPTDCYPTQRLDGPHRLPNAFGLVIGHDPYRAESTADPAVDCGGDGGRATCGGYGCFLGWMTLATAYRDRFYDVWPGSDHEVVNWGDVPSQPFVRPVIELG